MWEEWEVNVIGVIVQISLIINKNIMFWGESEKQEKIK